MTEIIVLLQEIERRIQEMRKKEGEDFELVVDFVEWIDSRYNHQN
jgi:hypothetical protein